MAKNRTDKNSLPIVVTVAVVIATITFVVGVIVGNLVPAPLTPEALASWVSAIATALIGVLTFFLATETWRLRAAQTEQLADLRRDNIRPNVGIELKNSPAGVHFMNVKVNNLGKGIARKVRFEFLDRDNNPVNPDSEPIVKVFQKLSMFRLGIESMGINQELKSFIFSFLELEKELGAGIFTPFLNIRIRFEDTSGHEYVNAFVVDFAQYEGFVELGSDPLYQMSDDLKSIREQLAKVIDASKKRLSVDVFNSQDRETEREVMHQRMEEMRERRKLQAAPAAGEG